MYYSSCLSYPGEPYPTDRTIFKVNVNIPLGEGSTGNDYTYQWKISSNGSNYSDINTSTNSDTYTHIPGLYTYYIKCVVTDDIGRRGETDPIMITVFSSQSPCQLEGGLEEPGGGMYFNGDFE